METKLPAPGNLIARQTNKPFFQPQAKGLFTKEPGEHFLKPQKTEPFFKSSIQAKQTTNTAAVQRMPDLQRKDDEELTQAHKDVNTSAGQWNDPDASSVAWTTADIMKWKWKGNKYLFEQKAKFAAHYRFVIKDAAAKYDIPLFLLAGVAFQEYGGDPMWIDDVADNVRSFDWSGPDWVDKNMTITKNPDLTSFGNISIQVRRAAETLDYDPKKITSKQRSAIVDALKDPIKNIYIAAKHLSSLRNVDFKDKATADLTKEDIIIIAARYNRGPQLSLEEIKKNLSYGETMYKHKDEIDLSLAEK